MVPKGTLMLIAESRYSTSDENIICGNKHKIPYFEA
jgi:hypothetical protein